MLRVLLVCTGNICRSPMAEGLLEQRSERLFGGNLVVRSVGLAARGGSPPTPEAIEAAAERGADISELRSTPFTSDHAWTADVVITMTARQRHQVVGDDYRVAKKTFTLKELVALLGALPPPSAAPSREAALERIRAADALRRSPEAPSIVDEDVSDPLGLSGEAYRAVAWELEGLVDGLVEGLFGRLREASAAVPGSGA